MLAQAERSIEHQSLALAHRPDHSRHRVAAELLEGCDSLVPVDDQIATWLIGHCHHHDRRLLAHLGQGSQQPPLALGTANPQMLEAAVELMKLHVHGRSWSGRSDHVLRRPRGKCSWNSCGIRQMRRDHVFRSAEY